MHAYIVNKVTRITGYNIVNQHSVPIKLLASNLVLYKVKNAVIFSYAPTRCVPYPISRPYTTVHA